MELCDTRKMFYASLVKYKEYFLALLLIASEVLTVSLFHLMGQSGQMFLPVYFFIILTCFFCGWKMGAVSALIVPSLNFIIFQMPALALLPFVLLKGSLLVVFFLLFYKVKSLLLNLILIVFSYQIVGMLIVFLMTSKAQIALLDVKVGFWGLLLQVFLVLAILKLLKREKGNIK